MRLKPHSNRFKRLRALFQPKLREEERHLYQRFTRQNKESLRFYPGSARAAYQKAKSTFKHGMAR